MGVCLYPADYPVVFAGPYAGTRYPCGSRLENDGLVEIASRFICVADPWAVIGIKGTPRTEFAFATFGYPPTRGARVVYGFDGVLPKAVVLR